ncbi:hypothetical protein SLEP1_g14564 [Rubroshorea leprosula]|uniref:Uncharacterized protein n=1 Tax=Rubroshorea leprosula TaxID=152421 RepID=A0AAV5ITC5_9ROSI|nr:hypothetical protein SLEP1_g14564 [Rubroshorea leprosula]
MELQYPECLDLLEICSALLWFAVSDSIDAQPWIRTPHVISVGKFSDMDNWIALANGLGTWDGKA